MTDTAQSTIDLLTTALVNAMADQIRRLATFEKSLKAANTIGDHFVAKNCTRSINSLNKRILNSAMALQAAGVKNTGDMLEKMQAATEPPKHRGNVLSLVRLAK